MEKLEIFANFIFGYSGVLGQLKKSPEFSTNTYRIKLNLCELNSMGNTYKVKFSFGEINFWQIL